MPAIITIRASSKEATRIPPTLRAAPTTAQAIKTMQEVTLEVDTDSKTTITRVITQVVVTLPDLMQWEEVDPKRTDKWRMIIINFIMMRSKALLLKELQMIRVNL